MIIALAEVLPKSRVGKSAESSTLVFFAKSEVYNKNYLESLCFSLLSDILIYKKIRPLKSDLGAVHGHSFDPVPSYFYALQRYNKFGDEPVFFSKLQKM